MTKRKPIVVVGSINMDLVVRAEKIPAAGETLPGTDFETQPGGKGANQAVAIARLGCPVRLIGSVGADSYGAQLRDALVAAGVDCEAVRESAGSASGIAAIVVTPRGENSIVAVPGANALVSPHDLEVNIALLRGAAFVLAQLEIPVATVEHLAALCKRENVPLILDPAPAQALPDELLRSIAWFTPNETEAAFYAGASAPTESESLLAILQQRIGFGRPGILLKQGERGVLMAHGIEQPHELPAFPVRAVDTTAAGDAFNGAFAVGLLAGKTPVESARFAAAAAACSVTRRGAQHSMPTLREVEALLSGVEPQRE